LPESGHDSHIDLDERFHFRAAVQYAITLNPHKLCKIEDLRSKRGR